MTSDFFVNNRRRLAQLAKANGPIVIAANGLLQRNGDTSFPFRQESNFYYLTGINEPDLVLVINNSSEYLIVPGRDQNRANFDGALSYEALAKASGISEILGEKSGWEKLKLALAKTSEVATLAASPSYVRHYGLFTNPARTKLARKLKAGGASKITDIKKTLAEMRVIKQPVEIDAVQEAINITAGGIKKVASELAIFSYEYEIEASLSASFRGAGTSGHSFSPIVAGGANACTLHNIANNSKLNSGELITLDVGAEVDNYAADITRTLAIGKPSARQRQVYDAVLEAQNFALGLLKPGADFIEYENKVASFLGEKLVELKLLRTSSHDGIRRYCPHATSHFLGLDVHDVGDYHQPLAENMVLTCEPGIYIPEEKIGVRIEDDVLITVSGNKVLSANLARKL